MTANDYVLFRCHVCGTRFLGSCKEENDVIQYAPSTCPRCGHVESRTLNLFDSVREIQNKSNQLRGL